MVCDDLTLSVIQAKVYNSLFHAATRVSIECEQGRTNDGKHSACSPKLHAPFSYIK